MSAVREDDQGRASSNTIGGSARFYGPTVQARDVHGGIQVRTAPPQPPPTPRQLLPVPAHFTDRRDELEALDRLLTRHTDAGSRQPLIVVNGPAGIGKTTLVSRWLRRRRISRPRRTVARRSAGARGGRTGGPG